MMDKREYYQKNRLKIIKYQKKYRKKYPKKVKERKKRYYQQNKKKILSKQKDYVKKVKNTPRYILMRKISSKKWRNKNKKYMLDYIKEYKKNPKNNKIILSRRVTHRMLQKYPYLISKKCKGCNSLKELEIHHEVYPTIFLEIKKAIAKNRIYYLCKSCHHKRHK